MLCPPTAKVLRAPLLRAALSPGISAPLATDRPPTDRPHSGPTAQRSDDDVEASERGSTDRLPVRAASRDFDHTGNSRADHPGSATPGRGVATYSNRTTRRSRCTNS